MDNIEGVDDDDQGLGWLEVKRKSRSLSKLTVHRASAASSSSRCGDISNLRFKSQSLPSKIVSEVATIAGGPLFRSLSLKEKGSDEDIMCLDKQVVEQEGSSSAHGVVRVDNLHNVTKIKWGNLEEEDVIGCGFFGNSSGIFSRNDVCSEKAGGANVSISKLDDSLCLPMEKWKQPSLSDREQFPDGMLKSSPVEEILQGTWKEVNEISSFQVEPINLKENCGGLMKNPEGICKEYGLLVRSVDGDHLTSNKRSETSDKLSDDGLEPLQANNNTEDRTINICEVPSLGTFSGSICNSNMTEPLNESSSNHMGVESDSAGAMEEGQLPLYGSNDNIDQGEGGLVEGKERFRQRLWRFLFENLNRAVDELYLLCELECDMEQIEEAILVIKESSLDFKELKSRVERFDNTKRSSCQCATDGSVVNAKEHRRPHALSWEVRRMTTSPHQAEILSSSLEAFKRIQMERAGRSTIDAAELLNRKCQTAQSVCNPNDKNMKSSAACVSKEEAGGIIHSKMESLEPAKEFSLTNNDHLNPETYKSSESILVQNCHATSSNPVSVKNNVSARPLNDETKAEERSSKEKSSEPLRRTDKQVPKKDKVIPEHREEKHSRMDSHKRQSFPFDKEKEKRTSATWKSMDAWKEKRNWEDILKSPMRNPSKVSHSPSLGRKNVDRARDLHDKLMSPEKKKKTALDMKREAEEKHARAMRIRSQLENERVQRLQRTSEKLNRVNEWQAVRSLKLREGMNARQQRSESRHEAYLAQVAKRAGDESSKVNEVRFITSLNEENKKHMLRQKLHDYELRRAEKLQIIRTKQKEDIAKEEAVSERRKLLEAEKQQRLAETQRRKEEAQLRREEERKASSAAREARSIEQLRRKEDRAKAQQEESELLAQKLAEKLSESEQRRKLYLEQIRERASMDFRDQSSPLLRRSINKEGQNRAISTNNIDDYQVISISGAGVSSPGVIISGKQQLLKKRIKKIRQRLMALKYEFSETLNAETVGFGSRALIGAAKLKIGRWLQDIQRLRQARKEGFSSIGLIVGDIIKFLEGKELELHASRQAGLIDFVASALPASHTPKPDASQVTAYLLRLLRVLLSVQENRNYFLSQNLLPPIIPMLSAYLEKYIKVAASCNVPANALLTNNVVVENLESIAEILEGLLWTATMIIGHVHIDERNQKMQDGLVELVISYQVIHHLRDLFALYDRPQIEGSPFPSSILLSLKLLAVLTSGSNNISSTDWESLLARPIPSSYTQEMTLPGKLEALSSQDSCTGHGMARDDELQKIIHLHPQNLAGSDMLENWQLHISSQKDPCVSLLNSDKAPLERTSVTETCLSNEVQLEEKGKPFSQGSKASNIDAVERDNVTRSVSCAPAESKKEMTTKMPVAFLLSAIAETSFVSLPSLLTAVLLQANTRISSDQTLYILPSNFEEVATAVLKIMNNVALLDIDFLQNMLARTDLKMEFFHLMGFLLPHCTSKWKVASDQMGLLLLESLLLLRHFSLLHPGNQAVLRWGKSPTILHKICDLPFVFFSDPELTPILASTIVAACYGCEQNRYVVQQEVSMDMLLSLLKSFRRESIETQPGSLPPNHVKTDDACDNNKTSSDLKRSQVDLHLRFNQRSTKSMSGKVVSGSYAKSRKSRIQRDSRGTKCCYELDLKTNRMASRPLSSFTLHGRFPTILLDKAEEFFTAGSGTSEP